MCVCVCFCVHVCVRSQSRVFPPCYCSGFTWVGAGGGGSPSSGKSKLPKEPPPAAFPLCLSGESLGCAKAPLRAPRTPLAPRSPSLLRAVHTFSLFTPHVFADSIVRRLTSCLSRAHRRTSRSAAASTRPGAAPLVDPPCLVSLCCKVTVLRHVRGIDVRQKFIFGVSLLLNSIFSA